MVCPNWGFRRGPVDASGRHQRQRQLLPHSASYAFPSKSGSTGATAAAAAQSMVGSVLIPSNLGLAHTNARLPPLENNLIAHLPGACQHWCRWNTTTTEAGGQTLDETLGLALIGTYCPRRGAAAAVCQRLDSALRGHRRGKKEKETKRRAGGRHICDGRGRRYVHKCSYFLRTIRV